MDQIIKNICEYYSVLPTDIAKKRWGSLPELTYSDIIKRLLLCTGPMIEAFPEMSKATISTLLCKVFPGKPKQNQEWCNYLLGLVRYRRCSTCISIQGIDNFYYIESADRYICKQCDSIRKAEYRYENKEAVKVSKQVYYTSNKESIKTKHHEYYKSHQAEFVQRNIKRNLQKELATPKWASVPAMNLIYSNREEGEHVDHIIPLQHPLVCGLHNEFNLQYLSAAENISKSNKFSPDTYEHDIPNYFAT